MQRRVGDDAIAAGLPLPPEPTTYQALPTGLHELTQTRGHLATESDPPLDPGGPGTAPGNRFAVTALRAVDPEQEGMSGEIILPTHNSGSVVVPVWEIREDIVDARLGMPRDLNGDTVIDELNHADKYTILPVEIRLRWRGKLGTREFRLNTVLSELR